jgi:fructoselysine-6-P-deglycase FrlB-like protein
MLPNSLFDEPKILVLLSSKSGETCATVQAAEKIKDRKCKKQLITSSLASSLGRLGYSAFFTGNTTQSFHVTFMVMLAYMSGIWTHSPNWNHGTDMISSLLAFPHALAAHALKIRGQISNSNFINAFSPYETIVMIGNCGAGTLILHGTSKCFIEERLKFFVMCITSDRVPTSFIEVFSLDEKKHVFLFLTEDANRKDMEAVRELLDQIGTGGGLPPTVYDTKVISMPGIADSIRTFFGPIFIDVELKLLSAKVADKHSIPLNELKFMGKIC